MNRRKIKHILVKSGAQLRLFYPFAVLLIVNVLTWMAAYWWISTPAAANSTSEIVRLETAHYLASNLVVVGLVGVTLSGLLTFIFWLTLSHRIFGPEVPILRQLDQMIAGNFQSRIRLRRRDEWMEVANRINQLSEKLAKGGNERGQAIVQVLVGAAIVGILIMAMVSMQILQVRENTALGEKLSAVELLRVTSATENDAAACNALFAPTNIVSPASLTFDATGVSAAAPFVITVRQIPGVGTSPPVATQNSPASPTSGSLFVPTGGIQIRVSSPNSADLVVRFQQNRLVRPIHDVSVRLNLVSTGPLNNTTIVGCSGVAPGTFLKYTVADLNGMPRTNVAGGGGPADQAFYYDIAVPPDPNNRHLLTSVLGVWNVTACGMGCVTSLSMTSNVGGTQAHCGLSQSTGSSGAYTNVVAQNVSCVTEVPASAPVTFRILFDGRGGAFGNFDAATYNTGAVTGTSPVFTIYTLP